METFKVDSFELKVSQDTVTISNAGPGSVTITPGEHANFRELVSVVWRMSSLPAMPDQIPVYNFLAKAFPNGEIEVGRSEAPPTVAGLRFRLGQCDSLVKAVDAGVSKSLDMKSLNPSPRGTGAYVHTNDGSDLIDGRV